jgi:hypothetical protein
MLRQRGYTTWILESALINPKVFIVCGSVNSRNFAQIKYRDMVRAAFLTERTTPPIYLE